MKKYAERSKAKRNYRKIKGGHQKLNFEASKPGVGGRTQAPWVPLDPLVPLHVHAGILPPPTE